MRDISLNVQQLFSLLPLLSVPVIPESHSEVVPETSGIQNAVFRGIPEKSKREFSVFTGRSQKPSENASLTPRVINKTKPDIPEIIANISEPVLEADIALNPRHIKGSLRFVRNINVNEILRVNRHSNALPFSVNAIIRNSSEAVATLQTENSVNEQLRRKTGLLPSQQHRKSVFGNVCLLSGGRH
ncbi:hypothetical protein ACO1PK_08370 [Alishewanella sp. d11]|uniref:hypothetical protein n=1 Tax=Alishewanella sp. d11 TaxID=3414030 RepID=UPI003BF9243F